MIDKYIHIHICSVTMQHCLDASLQHPCEVDLIINIDVSQRLNRCSWNTKFVHRPFGFIQIQLLKHSTVFIYPVNQIGSLCFLCKKIPVMDIYKYDIKTNYLYSYGNMFTVKKQEFSKMNWCCFWGNILLNYKVEFQGNTVCSQCQKRNER